MKEDTRYSEWVSGFNFLTYQNKTITQKALAELVGVDKGYINSILKGRKDAGDRLQDAISRALGFSHDNIRFFGRQLLAGHAPERVGVLARLFRENKVPSEMTPEELEVCEEFLGPPLAEAGAAWRAQMEARRNELARALSARPDALQYLRSLLYRGDAPAPPVTDAAPARYVTVLRRVSAGEPREFCDDDVVGRVAVGSDIPAGAYAWQVSGDSMLRPDGRGIRDGDVVFFVEETRPAHNDVVLVNDEFGDTVLKRLKLRPDGGYVLVSDNPDYKSVTPNEAFRIVGKVVDVIRKPDWR